MIPILYESTETTFTSNGIGRLSDAVSCTVTEERNGPYELEMEYPVSGIHYDDIQLFRIIFAIPADGKTGQPFEIYDISRPLNGIVTIRAWHISYRLNKIVVKPFTAASCSLALAGLATNSTTTNPFTFSTDKTVAATFTVKTPTECRGLLGGQAGSILDVFGKGDYEFDKWTVYLRTNRGVDNGVTIRYGKNLTALDADAGMDNVYTGIVPYYYNDDTGELVTITGFVLWGDHRTDYPVDMVRPVDLSDKWDESAPTSAQLQTAAEAYMDDNPGWELSTNLRVSFVALADTEEYKDASALQRVNLCDTVTIIHEVLGVSTTAKVVKTEYDVLLERYNSIELGTASVSLGQAIEDSIINSDAVPTTSEMQMAIAHGTDVITGNSGGHIVLKKNANNKPEEFLVMDTENINTATNVWRWNSSGLGFSPNGYAGPYNTAWTYDGKFYVDWVTTGSINADLVNTGTISSKNGNIQIVLAETGNNGQLIITSGNLQLDANGNLTITGEVNAQTGSIGGFTIDNNSIYSGTKGSGTSNGDITLSSDNFQRDIDNGDSTSTTRQNLRFAIGKGFAVRRDGAVFAGNLIANAGRIGGDNGLKILSGTGIYSGSKSSLLSGENGIYIGTDGISIGSQGDTGKKKPLMWLDQANEKLNVMRLDFKEPTNTSPYYTNGHSLYMDSNNRLMTGGGMTIGMEGSSSSSDWDGEYNTRIGNTTFAAIYDGSDRRIKKNIRELTDEEARAFVMGCNPVEFEYSEPGYPEGIHHGMIAQDVQGIVKNWDVVGGSEDSTLALHYVEMIADLIKVCQNQEKRIEALEAALKEKE